MRNVQDTKALADFVRRFMADNRLSTYAVEKRSGHKISHGAVNNIANGKVKEIRASKVAALAEGLGVNPVTLHAVLYPRPSVKADFWERWAWLEQALDLLPSTTRADVEGDLEAIAKVLITRRNIAA